MQTNHKTLIFVHVPKAAGQTLMHILNRQYSASSVFSLELASARQQRVNEIRNLAETEKRRLCCIRGHVPFGLHRWLPQEVTYVSILRRPVQRIVSYYNYVWSYPVHQFHSKVVQRKMSLKDFARMIMDINETNLQTRFISGLVDFDSLMPPYDDLPSNALELAKQNISSFFAVVGLTERFDESLLLMQRVLGWKTVFYSKRNVGKRRSAIAELPSSTLRLIEKCEELDAELYEFAHKRLTKMLDDYGIDDNEVHWFQAHNRIFGTPLCTYERLTRRLMATGRAMLSTIRPTSTV